MSDTLIFISLLVAGTLIVMSFLLELAVSQSHNRALRHEIVELREQVNEPTTP